MICGVNRIKGGEDEVELDERERVRVREEK
jgi:hypothetical protein